MASTTKETFERALSQHHVDAYLWTVEGNRVLILRRDGRIITAPVSELEKPHLFAETLPKRPLSQRHLEASVIPYVEPDEFHRIRSWWLFLRNHTSM